jgi:hypothetical protein
MKVSLGLMFIVERFRCDMLSCNVSLCIFFTVKVVTFILLYEVIKGSNKNLQIMALSLSVSVIIITEIFGLNKLC